MYRALKSAIQRERGWVVYWIVGICHLFNDDPEISRPIMSAKSGLHTEFWEGLIMLISTGQ